MARDRLPRISDERLDAAGRAVVRAAARAGAEADEAAAAPFLYARVRARVDEQKRREAEAGAGWLALLQVARRAVPTMAFVAALAAALLFWAASFGARHDGGRAPLAFVGDDVIFGAAADGVESAVLRDSGQLSHDEILNMVVNRAGREGANR
jgi:hypothetical protein